MDPDDNPLALLIGGTFYWVLLLFAGVLMPWWYVSEWAPHAGLIAPGELKSGRAPGPIKTSRRRNLSGAGSSSFAPAQAAQCACVAGPVWCRQVALGLNCANRPFGFSRYSHTCRS